MLRLYNTEYSVTKTWLVSFLLPSQFKKIPRKCQLCWLRQNTNGERWWETDWTEWRSFKTGKRLHRVEKLVQAQKAWRGWSVHWQLEVKVSCWDAAVRAGLAQWLPLVFLVNCWLSLSASTKPHLPSSCQQLTLCPSWEISQWPCGQQVQYLFKIINKLMKVG